LAADAQVASAAAPHRNPWEAFSMIRILALTALGIGLFALASSASNPGRRARLRARNRVRNAGPAFMRDRPKRWDQVDEQSDESFPASDPPGNY
jgi:hypothetical protein